ncbi:MMPL family transporter [Aquibacillus koreensis]|uniref:MMPL family transporter n=1 Tax=Aquibacillus koreensis TaxID=279446 RepID=A0A9X4AHL8_9BACI|nr:MMPL family transporter [Aquibacillus koreensis]MCT2535792.1 MMPL family transporter [Aquibacillus koreensis]MDC3420247.1 MMPL family transporter [Aquibacillus koreensis]
MRKILQFRWPIFVLWIVTAVSLLLFSPNLQELVREKGQIGVPEGYSSSEASALLGQMSEDNDENTISGVLVFHEEQALTDQEKNEVADVISKLEEQQEALGVSNILNFTADERIEEQVVSEDGTTILVPMDVTIEDRTIEESRDVIYKAVEGTEIDYALTGEAYISKDIVVNSEKGLKKTEFITVGFILIILFIVFKSLVAPFIPLLTVGISYLAAQGIVSILAETANFPLSTFTQIFMVAVMFGIGTDYCILLISRFKEELANHETIQDAVVATYKSGGKTIFFAGLAVLIGFSTIGLSTFSLYKSAVAVAVGVAVVLIALATLVPFFLVLFGKKLFWPFDKNVSHSESKLWKSVGLFAWGRPLLALLIVLVIVVPSLVTFDGQKSYNSLEEIGENYDSVKGFNWLAESVGPGEAMPATVVLQTEENIDEAKEFQDIETISAAIATIDGVKSVRSATRPTGKIIEDFTMNSQTGALSDGIGESASGINEIQSGLTDASDQLKESRPQLKEAETGVDQLLDGTKQANNGIGEMQNALTQIQNGISSGSQGAGEVKENLKTIQTNLQQTIDGNNEILTGYQELESGLTPLHAGYQGYTQLLQGTLQTLDNVEASNEESVKNLETAKGQLHAVLNGTEENPGLLTLNETFEKQVIGGITQANQGFQQTIDGQQQLANGLTELIAGIDQLQNGLNQAADGQQQVVDNIPSLQDGLEQIYGGQEELQGAFSDMYDQMGQLTNGLDQSTDGLKQVSEGLTQVQNYLGEFSSEEAAPTVNIPKEALENEAFMEGIKPYLADTKTITKLEVVMESSPYSKESMETVGLIKQSVDEAVKGTVYEDATIAIGGISSTNNDLQNISDADYARTVVLMLAGIFIILVILLRSIIMPLYLIGSLILTYFTAMGISEFIFVNILDYEGISWAVSFFAFVILVALGIDYSIFLMDRFNENMHLSIKEALIHAMKNMGTVIISAAVILGGTFAAMMPSGVLSLLQIATVVLTGLFLYALIMLPLFIPVMVRLFGKANWWPFRKPNE